MSDRRDYMREYQRRWVAERRALWFSDKSCIDCGATDNLELDHRDPATKVTSSVWSWAPVRRDTEVAKCVVRCHPCHKYRHAEEMRRPVDEHGNTTRYRHGCKCQQCKDAAAAAKRDLRARSST